MYCKSATLVHRGECLCLYIEVAHIRSFIHKFKEVLSTVNADDFMLSVPGLTLKHRTFNIGQKLGLK